MKITNRPKLCAFIAAAVAYYLFPGEDFFLAEALGRSILRNAKGRTCVPRGSHYKRCGEADMEKQADEFRKYQQELYPRALENTERMLREATLLPWIELFTLRIMFALEKGEVSLKGGDSAEFLRTMLSKMVQELLGYLGCLRAASLFGSTHHLRSLLEIEGCVKYLTHSEKRTKARLRKFNEYGMLIKYQRYSVFRAKVSAGKITEEEYATNIIVPPYLIAQFTEEKLKEWRKLWSAEDLSHVVAWHYPAAITNLIELDDDPEASHTTLYAQLCHGTHVSPVSNVFGAGRLVFQPADLQHIHSQTLIAVGAIRTISERVDKLDSLGLLEIIDPIYNELGRTLKAQDQTHQRPNPSA